MGLSPAPAPGVLADPPSVVWHDLECGAYAADLSLWHELAMLHPGPVLDVGAGTGRVALALARAGREVTALERDGELLAALGRRAQGLAVELVHADACSFELERRDYALCLVPMQTLQLLGGSARRGEFLRRAQAHLRPGGLLACAVLERVEPFDCSDGNVGPEPEHVVRGESRYVSRAIRVQETASSVVIERERSVLPARSPAPAWPFARQREARIGSRERNVVELNRVAVATVHEEGQRLGLRPERTRTIPATDEHVGSSVAMLGRQPERPR
ncbi:MAG TPA: class I SAM-dependent methyltransferase [Solirubrobacteraceae bacterium]|nr:class I SAM-dependent methyltransferase [Solirubrobacteraceae bacterium]